MEFKKYFKPKFKKWSNQNDIKHLSKPEISCKVQEISENLIQ